MNFGDDRLPQIFWDKVVPEPNSGCWLFVGAQSKAGYGQIRRSSTTLYAHRETYRVCNGEIPSGLDIDHRCRVRCCVNPLHLDAVSHRENMRRSPLMVGPLNRRGVALRPPLPNCPCGRQFDLITYRSSGKRHRACSFCQKARWSARQERRKNQGE